MNFRTDLALERREYIDKHQLDGIISHKKTINGITVHTITVENEKGEKLLGKPCGTYITLEAPDLLPGTDSFDACLSVLTRELTDLLPRDGLVLVAGLGNENITPDALGPKCISQLLATRHIDRELAKSIGFQQLRPVAALVPGVLGKTGIESTEIISGISDKIKPGAVILIDALASRSTERLGRTIQLCDTGISPGSGVGNSRGRISKETLGVPVIALGVPTVVDSGTLAFDILEKAGATDLSDGQRKQIYTRGNMMVTPKEIDNLIDAAAHLIAMSINSALQPEIPAEDILAIIG